MVSPRFVEIVVANVGSWWWVGVGLWCGSAGWVHGGGLLSLLSSEVSETLIIQSGFGFPLICLTKFLREHKV
nr:hypothetical protein CFP56_39675 [Quercus suber]